MLQLRRRRSTLITPASRRSVLFCTACSYIVVWLAITAVVTNAFSIRSNENNTRSPNNNGPNKNNNPSTRETGTTKNVATQILQGVGVVDDAQRNQYNIRNVNDIVAEWTVYRYQRVNDKSGQHNVRLGCRNNQDIMVDTVTVQYPRTGNGLGLELEEIAGGGSGDDADGKAAAAGRRAPLGITIVTKAVGEPARVVDIWPGDSLARVTLIRTMRLSSAGGRRTAQTEERFVVDTECLDFDETVRRIQSLPVLDDSYQELWSLTLKRLRRRPKVAVTVRYPPRTKIPDQTVSLYAGENLRQALLVKKISVNDPSAQRFDGKAAGSNCGAGGLCRTCRVQIEQGADLLNPQRPAERTMLSRDGPRSRLACKAIVGFGMKEGALVVKAYPDQWQPTD
jgi:ferredoxin